MSPVKRVRGGWSFGGGTHTTRAGAERSYRAYLASNPPTRKKTRR